MTQVLALRIAALAYLVLSALFASGLFFGLSITGQVIAGVQQASLAVLAAVSIGLAVWTWRTQRAGARLSFSLYSSSFVAAPVFGVGLGQGFLIPLLLVVPFVFLAIAWSKAKKKADQR